MQLPVKVGIAAGSAFVFFLTVGFVVFPKMITSQVKKMTALKPGNEIRDMFIKIPFYLDFRIFMFNISNPDGIQNGEKPIVQQVGPFCYEEWKVKVGVEDIEEEDMLMYNQTDTFLPANWPGCVDPDTMVTIPHPMILGLVNAVTIQKPGALSLLNKAIKSIYENPSNIFLTAKAKDILFDGIVIKCGIKDFAGKAICSQLKSALPNLNENDLIFSLLGAKNGTAGKRFQVYRGVKNAHQLGEIVKYDNQSVIENWPTKQCNEIHGTDGTIFPPFLTNEEGLVSFSPDLCRSLKAFFVKPENYDGIPAKMFTANLGDSSTNANEKCYCTTPETCLKKGLMDLFKCTGVPIYASLPHFLDADKSYLDGVQGLSPDAEIHQIKILFETTTGSPLYAKKRLQFNMPLNANDKVDLFKTMPSSVLPLFWIEEGVELNNTFTKPLKDLFKIKKIVKIGTWLVMVVSVVLMAGAAYVYFSKSGSANVTPVEKSDTPDNVKNMIHMNMNYGMNDEGHVNPNMTNGDPDKY
ncbi:unnamed protein product [Brassicogethes aeneus]|uniref:Sensory neuron membrane protein 1 n=1 Tax=Brassicogethes aeneus TaxID=1431903 RepID=A0A9P0FM29_BRAAE|nr:unnamed protein product [Brassicogethes aeneus]